MTFVIIAHYRAVPGAEQQVADLLGQMVTPSQAEPGNHAYRVCRSASDPAVFAIYEEYQDAEAFGLHVSSAHFERCLRGGVLPLLQERHRHDLVLLSD